LLGFSGSSSGMIASVTLVGISSGGVGGGFRSGSGLGGRPAPGRRPPRPGPLVGFGFFFRRLLIPPYSRTATFPNFTCCIISHSTQTPVTAISHI
jgi:hypothetical protein